MDAGFTIGGQVSARGLVWEVADVVPLGEQTLLRLRCAAGDLTGLTWHILSPAEAVVPVQVQLRPDVPGSLAAWRLYHQACLLDQVLPTGKVLGASPGRVQVEAWQLVPLLRALELPRVRLLLADGVGLGKTIEAGLIVCELLARRRAHRVLIIAPSGPLLIQWQQEFRQRFGLRFLLVADAAALQEQRRKLELGGNPFDAVALCLTSLDFAKQERVLEELERSTWDLAIIDEAHHCIATGVADHEETERRRLAEVVARRADGLLLVTATPHDGYDQHFASLLELLDPSLVDGRGSVVGTAYRRHVVRRLKPHIRDASTGAPVFRERQVRPIRVEITSPAAREFHTALAALIVPRLRRAARVREQADALAFVSLLKRSVSTISACVATLLVVVRRYGQGDLGPLQRERAQALRAHRRRLLRFGMLDQIDECDMAELEAEGMAADLQSFAAAELTSLMQTAQTIEAMNALIRLGQGARLPDPKLAALAREIADIRSGRPDANIVVYTEYTDSQLAAVHHLRRVCAGEVLAINGLDSEAERLRATDRFATEGCLVLVSTDTLAEGLNLQQRCCDLIHLDLPYNPNRLEQRNGRVDRYGQRHDPTIRYLYLAGTFEERLLLRLIAKYEKARAQLDVMPPTLGVTADASEWQAGLVSGLAERQAGLFDEEPSAIRMLDRAAEDANADAYRDLLREIDRAFDGFERSAVRHGWVIDHEPSVPPATAGNWSIDLPDFVAAAIGATDAHDGCLPLPSDWLADLDGLPGLDRAEGLLRYTRDNHRLRDEQGRALAVLGRAHPLVRRAISAALRVSPGATDNRIGAAQTEPGSPPAVLFTYAIELSSATNVELRQVLAVLLPMEGAPILLGEPAQWLQFADRSHAVPTGYPWQRLFAQWVSERQTQADSLARNAMLRDVERFAAEHRRRLDVELHTLCLWLRDRADRLCGVYAARTGDLFGAAPAESPWRLLADPLERLAAYAGDGDNPTARRRSADSAVEIFRRRSADFRACAEIREPVLRPIGMLMLVPRDA